MFELSDLSFREAFLLNVRSYWRRVPALMPLSLLLIAFYLNLVLPIEWLCLGLSIGFFLFFIVHVLSKRRDGFTGSVPWMQGAYRLGIFLSLLCLFYFRIRLFPDFKLPFFKTIVQSTEGLRQKLLLLLSTSELSSSAQLLSKAMALGFIDKGFKGYMLRQQFVSSGVAHILAVSGFHLGLVMTALMLMLRRLTRTAWGQVIQFILLLFAIIFFVLLTGGAKPTLRAGLMLALYLFGRLLRRPVSMPNLLCISLLTLLLLSPSSIYRAGLWISHVAVLSIYLFYRSFLRLVRKRLARPVFWLWESLCLSFSVQILVIPLCFFFFGSVSWSFIFTSLPISLLASLFIPLVFLYLPFACMGFAPKLLLYLINALAYTIDGISLFFSKIDCLYQEFELPFSCLLLYYFVLVIILFVLKTKEDLAQARPSLY